MKNKGKKYTIEDRTTGRILCGCRGISKKYRQFKWSIAPSLKPCKYGIKYATAWVNYLKEEDGDGWDIYEVEEGAL